MNKTPRHTVLVMVGALLIGLTITVGLGVGSAGAQGAPPCYPAGSPNCTTTTTVAATTTTARQVRPGTSARPGQPVTVTAEPGTFAGGTTLTGTIVFADGTTRSLGTFTANADGSFSGSITLPCDAPAGLSTITLRGNGPSGAPTSVETPVTIRGTSVCGAGGAGGTGDGSGTSGTLARTGATIVFPAVIVGFGLVALGMTLRRRFRKTSAVSAG